MIINHKNTKYTLDIDGAIKLGVMTKVPILRPVMIKDIPNNTIFRWRYKDNRTKEWHEYIMVTDTSSKEFYNCIRLDGKIGKRGGEALVINDEGIILELWDVKNQKWISEVEVD